VINKANIISLEDHLRVCRELKILKVAQHSSIAKLFEMIESKTKLYIVMEYCPSGELFQLIVN
jgi:serine/threonine protein kinase